MIERPVGAASGRSSAHFTAKSKNARMYFSSLSLKTSDSSVATCAISLSNNYLSLIMRLIYGRIFLDTRLKVFWSGTSKCSPSNWYLAFFERGLSSSHMSVVLSNQ